MKKIKCDKCGKKETLLESTMKIIGKSKNKMSEEELRNNHTRIGDNKTFQKIYCKECRLKHSERK